LSFDAWSIILKENELGKSLSFLLPSKCPIKRKLECIYAGNVQIKSESQNLGITPLGASDELGGLSGENSVENERETPVKDGGLHDILPSSSALHVKRRAAKAHVVVSEVCRSI
jgi:hypothetical protein